MLALQLTPPDGLAGVRISRLHFGPAGRTLAAVWRVCGNILGVAWWDLRTGRQVASEFGARLLEDDATPPDPALSPDHRLLARLENDRGGVQRLVLLDRSTPKGKSHRLTAWPYFVPDDYPGDFNYQHFTALSFAPDGSHLYAVVTGGHPEDDADERIGIYRWSVTAVLGGRGKKSAGHLLPDPGFFRPTPPPAVFEWAHFGPTLAVTDLAVVAGHWDKQVLGWSLPGGEPLPKIRVSKKRKQPIAWRVAVSPDGRTVAVADEAVTLYDTATGKPRHALAGGPVVKHPDLPAKGRFVFDLAFDPAGSLLAVACGDDRVHWYDPATGVERAGYDWGIGGVTAVAFSADGLLAAAAGADGRVTVWDVT